MHKLGSISVALTHALFIVTLPTIAHAQPKQIDLTGTWIGQGYSCENGGLSEKVELTITGNYLTAKKITGDNCVPAGNITFQGTLPDSFSAGSIFSVTWTVGTPTNPASGKTVQNLTVLDANSFSSYGVKFTRMKTQTGVLPSKPSVPSIGVQLGQIATRQATGKEQGKYPKDCGRWLREYVFGPNGIKLPPGVANTWAAWFAKNSETWQSLPNDGKFSTGDIVVVTREDEEHGHIMIVGVDGIVYDASLNSHGPRARRDIHPGAPIKQSEGEEVTVWRLKE